MTTWMQPASVSMLVATGILAATFGYLYRAYRERHLVFWTLAFLLSSVRYIFLVVQTFAGKSLPLTVGYNLATILGAAMMVCGARVFNSQRPEGRWAWFAVAALAWGAGAPFTGLSGPAIAIPIFFFLGAAYVLVGIVFLRGWPRPRPPTVTGTGTLFLFWGAHQFDYPVLRFVDWFAPVGYLIGGFFALSTAVGIILVYFERARLELDRNKERYRELVDHLDAGIAVYEPEVPGGRLLVRELNAAGRRFGGLGNVDVCGRPIDELFPGASEMGLLSFLEEVSHTGRSVQCPLMKYHDDRLEGWYDNFIYRLSTGEVVAVFSDVTEEHLHREALLEYKQFIENSDDMVAVVDREYRYRMANRAFLRMGTGAAEVVGRTVSDVLGEGPFAEIKGPLDRAFSGETVAFEMRLACPDERSRDLSVKYFPILGSSGIERVAAIIRDISEQKRAQSEKLELEANLRQAQKMEAIGTLAGGIAHDFNNILTPIMAHGELALMQMAEGDPVRNDISALLSAAERAAALVKQIMALSRKEDTGAPVPVNVGALVKETAKFLRASIPATIELRVDVDPECGPVLAEPSRLHQVILNLCTNASYAMADKGGVLSISLERQEVPDRKGRPAAGGRVRLKVSDTGPGIPPEVQGRIFEPYFTTKPVGKGSGLGLAVVHGIVASLGGEIRVTSGPGEGATFDVFLPETGLAAPPPQFPAQEVPRGSGQRILAVDDEPSIRAVLQRLLTSLNYRATLCESSAEALTVFRASPQSFDVVITDFTMPGMTGLDLAGEILRIRPGLPIVLGTGFAEAVNEQVARECGFRGLVMKPYTGQKLGEALRLSLEGAGEK